MPSLLEVEEAISHLPDEQLRQFRQWFHDFDQALWDRQMERDVQAGKLDAILSEARGDYSSGNSKPQ